MKRSSGVRSAVVQTDVMIDSEKEKQLTNYRLNSCVPDF